MTNRLPIDPAHASIDLSRQVISQDVWRDKYRYGDEAIPEESWLRVVDGVYASDPNKDEAELALEAITKGLFCPAGRILAGAGTPKRVTLMNCYVAPTIADSMDSQPEETPHPGIMDALKIASLTQQQGGGIGMDFSTIRPSGARLNRTGDGAVASGPLPFMDLWHSMCSTIMSAGSRRGAMMGTIADWHPDLPHFIVAKQTPGRMTNFNVSVLVSDAFMEAVKENADWHLYFSVEPVHRDVELGLHDFVDDAGVRQYVYSVWKAKELWELITKNTYEYSEPGIIFVDRVNDTNNLYYCEDIRCTNPCGEQPLPPNGTCNLSAINLSRMVKRPFASDAEFDFDLLKKIVAVGVRFLDNVIEATRYPTEAQANEERNKRRLGLGITGLADALVFLNLRYGSPAAAEFAERIMQTIAVEAYRNSIELAKERGAFPLFDKDKFLNAFFIKKLPESIRAGIAEYGIRNGVLLTIAPTGTTSVVFGNVSSGVEPIFNMLYWRKVRQADDTYKKYLTSDYAVNVWQQLNGELRYKEQNGFIVVDDERLPKQLVTALELAVEEHVVMQAACQRWVDASVSKTVNVPTETSYDNFAKVYELAYAMGCKGCTTYRPSDVRGSVLDIGKKEEAKKDVADTVRPRRLTGYTYKVKWPHMASAVYITINMHDDRPWELFITSKDSSHSEWITAITLMISAILRRGEDPKFLVDELKQIQSMHHSAWIQGKFYGSLPAYIGAVLEEFFQDQGLIPKPEEENSSKYKATDVTDMKPQVKGEICPSCHNPTVFRSEGCKLCLNCGHSECG